MRLAMRQEPLFNINDVLEVERIDDVRGRGHQKHYRVKLQRQDDWVWIKGVYADRELVRDFQLKRRRQQRADRRRVASGCRPITDYFKSSRSGLQSYNQRREALGCPTPSSRSPVPSATNKIERINPEEAVGPPGSNAKDLEANFSDALPSEETVEQRRRSDIVEVDRSDLVGGDQEVRRMGDPSPSTSAPRMAARLGSQVRTDSRLECVGLPAKTDRWTKDRSRDIERLERPEGTFEQSKSKQTIRLYLKIS